MGGLCTRLGTSPQDVAGPNSNSRSDRPGRQAKAKHPQDEKQAPQKNQTMKRNGPMMPSSCLSARCRLAYGKYGWPLYCTYEGKAKENEEGRLSQWQFG